MVVEAIVEPLLSLEALVAVLRTRTKLAACFSANCSSATMVASSLSSLNLTVEDQMHAFTFATLEVRPHHI
jgi:hypothetical protein